MAEVRGLGVQRAKFEHSEESKWTFRDIVGEFFYSYAALSTDEKTALAGMIKALRTIADKLEKHGFLYRRSD
jgi:hypothetical protein